MDMMVPLRKMEQEKWNEQPAGKTGEKKTEQKHVNSGGHLRQRR